MPTPRRILKGYLGHRPVNPSRSLAVLALALVALVAVPATAGAAPKRVVALSPFAANTSLQLGVKPIAIGQTLGGKERFARQLRNVRVLPLSHPNGPNLEQLASLNPDLVFSSSTWAKGNSSMRSLGMRVISRDPKSIAAVYRQTRSMGKTLGRPAKAAALVKATKRGVAQARRGIKRRPTVMLILGVGRTPFTFLPSSWGGNVVTNAGGRLLTGGVTGKEGFARISDEVVVAEDPDVIIAVPHANESDIPSLTEYLRSNPAWQTTSAVRNGRIHISVDNSLLQPGTDIARTIRFVRRNYLKN